MSFLQVEEFRLKFDGAQEFKLYMLDSDDANFCYLVKFFPKILICSNIAFISLSSFDI